MWNKTRVMPVLLLKDEGLVKTVNFKKPKYIGDPINAVRIFNEKEVDEIVILDISATPGQRGPNFDLLCDIANEAFMPMAYGGGITNLDQIRRVLSLGFEKVIINSIAYEAPQLVAEAAAIFGSQSIVGALDVRRNLWGRYQLVSGGGLVKQGVGLSDHLHTLLRGGVGELLVNSVDRDGTMTGYDLALLKEVTDTAQVPVIACGGAGTLEHFVEAIEVGQASALAAGSMFVFVGKHRAVLLSYPDRKDLAKLLP